MLDNNNKTNFTTNNHGENSGAVVSGNNNASINTKNTNNTYIFIPPTEGQKRKIPALIPKIIRALAAKSANEEFEESNDFQAYKVPDKLIYNNIRELKFVIEDSSKYYSSIDKFINNYDDSFTGVKNKILHCIHNIYLNEKGKIFTKLEESKKTDEEKLQSIADELLTNVKNRLTEIVNNSEENMDYEDLIVGMDYFICYSFIECKIFEKPPISLGEQ